MIDDAHQQNIIKQARRLADELIRPGASEFDKKERLPRRIIRKLAQKKFLLAGLPEAYGGLGLDPVYYGFFTEEIGKACCSTRSLITVQNSLIGETVLRWGTADQKEKWLVPMSKGDLLGAFALTEPDVGTNAKGVKTGYAKAGKEFVVNGRKKWTSFGGIADFFVVIAACGSEITAFIIERDRAGIEIFPQKGLLGNRASHIAEIVFQNVRVPEDHIIGKPGSGFSFIVNTALDHGRYSIAWAGVAIAQEALNVMVNYARRRRQFEKRLSEFQLVQRMIGNALTRTHASRALCVKAGKMRLQKHADAVEETRIAKYFTSKAAVKTASDAVQVFGGNGCWNQYPAERLYREAKLLEIIEGTSQIQQITIANYGLKKYYSTDHYNF